MGRFTIVTKKEKWTTTWFGNILILLILLITILIFIKSIQPFLAQNKPIESDILVVEGFVPDYALGEAMEIFRHYNCKLLIITGRERHKGAYVDHFDNDGLLSAATLIEMGFEENKLIVVSPDENPIRNRTFVSAVSLKNWITKNNSGIKSFNLATLSCHSRRSKLLFSKVFGEEIEIGIIALKNEWYEPKVWWATSEGFRDVLDETIAYIYARFFFFP